MNTWQCLHKEEGSIYREREHWVVHNRIGKPPDVPHHQRPPGPSMPLGPESSQRKSQVLPFGSLQIRAAPLTRLCAEPSHQKGLLQETGRLSGSKGSYGAQGPQRTSAGALGEILKAKNDF